MKSFSSGDLSEPYKSWIFFFIVSLYKNRFNVLTPLLDSVVEAGFF